MGNNVRAKQEAKSNAFDVVQGVECVSDHFGYTNEDHACMMCAFRFLFGGEAQTAKSLASGHPIGGPCPSIANSHVCLFDRLSFTNERTSSATAVSSITPAGIHPCILLPSRSSSNRFPLYTMYYVRVIFKECHAFEAFSTCSYLPLCTKKHIRLREQDLGGGVSKFIEEWVLPVCTL